MGSKLGILALLLAPLFCLDVVRGFEWVTAPNNSVNACAGSKVVFPWYFKVTEAERVVSINWIHDGALSSTILAAIVHNHFLPTPGYMRHVLHVTNAGLLLKDLSAEKDSGNYTVEVNVVTGGTYQTFRQTVHLHVMGAVTLDEMEVRLFLLETNQKTLLEDNKRLQEQEQSVQPTHVQDMQNVTGCCQEAVTVDEMKARLEANKKTVAEENKRLREEHVQDMRSVTDVMHKLEEHVDHVQQSLKDHMKAMNKTMASMTAAVTVDEMKARQSLLEANQKTLLEDNKRLQEQLQSLQQTHVQDKQSVEQTHVKDMQNVTDVMDNVESFQQSLKDRVESLNKTMTDFITVATTVDEMKANLSMLEANQKTLLEDNKRLREQLVQDIQSVEQTHIQDMQNLTDVMYNLQEQIDEAQRLQQCLMGKECPCAYGHHTVLDDSWRSTATGGGRKCDDNLKPGWYRFLLNGRNAVMPTTCVPELRCGTVAPYWLDLQGKALPVPGRQTEGRTCEHWQFDCCDYWLPVTVLNCGSFFIYKLRPRSGYCSVAYCVEVQL